MKQSIAWLFVGSVSLAVGSLAGGCGGDDTSPGAGGAGGSGGSSTGTAGSGGGSAGKAGSGGTGGNAGTAGTGGGTTDSGTDSGSSSIKCGTMTCDPIDPGIGMPLPPCCPPGEMNVCGVSLQVCLTTTPGTSDPRCQDVTIPMVGTLPGCCTVLGVCGADVGSPLGCNDLSGLGAGNPIPCGPDAGPPPPPPDSGPDSPQPPPTDSGGMDTGGGSDTGGGMDTGADTPPPTDGGRSDGGAADASGDRAG